MRQYALAYISRRPEGLTAGMAARVLRPEGKGFIFLDSHPAGCAATVDAMISETTGAREAAAATRLDPALSSSAVARATGWQRPWPGCSGTGPG